MKETTKAIVKQCKQKISNRYKEYSNAPGAIQFAKCQTDLERILSAYLAKYAMKNTEMEGLLGWVKQFKDVALNENIEFFQNHLLNTSLQTKTNKAH